MLHRLTQRYLQHPTPRMSTAQEVDIPWPPHGIYLPKAKTAKPSAKAQDSPSWVVPLRDKILQLQNSVEFLIRQMGKPLVAQMGKPRFQKCRSYWMHFSFLSPVLFLWYHILVILIFLVFLIFPILLWGSPDKMLFWWKSSCHLHPGRVNYLHSNISCPSGY